MPRPHDDWWTPVFVKHADLFAEFLESLKPAALREVRGLRRLLTDQGVPSNGRVVDIACGIGRHIVPVAAAGYTAVGCDFSAPLLARATAYAREQGLDDRQIRFYRTDYRDIDRTLHRAGEAAFDAAFSVFNSMGHFGEAGDLATFRAVRSIVRRGGVFVVEMSNRDWILRNYEASGVMRAGPELEIRERRRFDPELSVSFADWVYYRGARSKRRAVLKQSVAIRLYSIHELKGLLERTGWKYVRSYSGLPHRSPASLAHPRMVVVAR